MQTTTDTSVAAVVRFLAFGLILFAVIAAIFTFAAVRIRVGRGLRQLAFLWLWSTLAVSVLATLSALRNVATVRPPGIRDVTTFAGLYLLIFAVGFGAISWWSNRRIGRTGMVSASPLTIVKGVGVFFLALLILALPLVIRDASRLF